MLNDKLEVLVNDLKKMKKVAIAYSGGVDSNFLLKVAKDTLGNNVVAITINAMMHSSREIQEARDYAKQGSHRYQRYRMLQRSTQSQRRYSNLRQVKPHHPRRIPRYHQQQKGQYRKY